MREDDVLLGRRHRQHDVGAPRHEVVGWVTLTSPTIRRLVADLYTQLRDGLADLIRRHQDAGAISADVDPESAAHPLFDMIPGFLLQRLLLGPEDPETYARAADAILRA